MIGYGDRIWRGTITSTYIAPPIVSSVAPCAFTYWPPAKKKPWRATLASETVGIDAGGVARDAMLCARGRSPAPCATTNNAARTRRDVRGFIAFPFFTDTRNQGARGSNDERMMPTAGNRGLSLRGRVVEPASGNVKAADGYVTSTSTPPTIPLTRLYSHAETRLITKPMQP